MRYRQLTNGHILIKDFQSLPQICRDSAFEEWRIQTRDNKFGHVLENGKHVPSKIVEVMFPSEDPLDAELKFTHEDMSGKMVTTVLPITFVGDWTEPVWKQKPPMIAKEDW